MLFKSYEANMSQNFYKWQLINYRQIKSEKEAQQFILSGEVICLKHAETSGMLCYDENSKKRNGKPAYVRMYKGQDETDKITSNCMFEIEMHNPNYTSTVSQQGCFLNWKI